ncbi:MAG: type II toxin-antitoxin system HicA family toxin [Clostridia bacterium]|nr:type II toxin-antitoxin system HicA family toxin [Clostridia bacterium]
MIVRGKNKPAEVSFTKRRDLIKLLEKKSWRFLRSGGSHDVYTDGKEFEIIPRHKEINEQLAKAIIRRRKL